MNAAHKSQAEETKNAAVVVPKAMITSYMINAALGFVMTVTFCFVLVDYEAAVDSPAGALGLAYIQVFVNATGSVGGGAALIAVLTTLQVLGIVNWMASCARQIFAFARDLGFPFGHFIAKVDQAGTYPINSCLVVWAFVVLINLITLGSVVAFEAIVSLQILALMATYLVSLSCIIWRRFFGAPLPASPFTLGRFALPINIVAICYCIYLIIFLPWPGAVPVTAATMNWAIVMFSGIMLIAAIYYVFQARKTYKGMIESTTSTAKSAKTNSRSQDPSSTSSPGICNIFGRGGQQQPCSRASNTNPNMDSAWTSWICHWICTEIG